MNTIFCTFLALSGLVSNYAVAAATLPYNQRSMSRTTDNQEAEGDCPVARTIHGVVRGTHLNDDVSAFLGVPYAQPPVGDLRFRPPEPFVASADKNDDVMDATRFGPVCHQFHYRQVLLNNTIETTAQSEDCLNLNIFLPRNAPDSQLLPTLLWSYGGGFVEGGGSVPGM
jgi:carboxylesterase type B